MKMLEYPAQVSYQFNDNDDSQAITLEDLPARPLPSVAYTDDISFSTLGVGTIPPGEQSNRDMGPPPSDTTAAGTEEKLQGTKALIVFGVAVLINLVGIALVITAYSEATWYAAVCLKGKEEFVGEDEHGTLTVSCIEQTPLTYDHCNVYKRAYDQQQRNSGADEIIKPECPSKWLIVPLMYVAAACSLIGLVILIIIICSWRQKSLAVFRIGGILSFGMATLVIVSALCFLGFFISMITSNSWCKDWKSFQEVTWKDLSQESSQAQQERQMEKESNKSPHHSRETRSVKDADDGNDGDRDDGMKNCEEYNEKVFQPRLILAGGIITLIGGILYILAGVFMCAVRIRKKKTQPERKVVTGQGDQGTKPPKVDAEQNPPVNQQPQPFGSSCGSTMIMIIPSDVPASTTEGQIIIAQNLS